MVTKNCPKCDKQQPIACRVCPCGHSFTKKTDQPTQPTISSSRPRRTITRLNRTNLYAPARLRQANKPRVMPVKRTPKKRAIEEQPSPSKESTSQQNKGRMRTQSEPGTAQSVVPPTDDAEDLPKKRRGRFRTLTYSSYGINPETSGSQSGETSSTSSSTGSRDEDLYSNLSADKAMQYSIILAEINRKFLGQNFKPP